MEHTTEQTRRDALTARVAEILRDCRYRPGPPPSEPDQEKVPKISREGVDQRARNNQ